ncbi:MAG: hypothetical protein GEU86_22105 [Actinophytocola sp.]|nr:hypothetical protein [Actinophytocola sp.]
MIRADLDVWESELEGVLARIRPLFYRTDSKKHAEQYLRGLLSPIERGSVTPECAAAPRLACGIGSKGFRVYDWALIDSADPDHQYMVRRSIDDGELAFYHCYNPNHAGFTELVHVAGARWPIEECFGSAKNEVGLDNYQVRTWDAWHRHITLAMIAHTFLAVTAHKTKKRGAHKPHN